MKLNKRTIFQLSIVIFVTGIIGVLLMWIKRLFQFEGTPDGWLGYWGGIFGSVIGVIGALLVLREQINAEKIDNTFFNLLNIHNDTINRFRNLKDDNSDYDVFDRIYDAMQANIKKHRTDEIRNSMLNFVEKNKENFASTVQSMLYGISNLNADQYEELKPHEKHHNKLIQDLIYDLNENNRILKDAVGSSNYTNMLKYIDSIYTSVYSTNRYSFVIPYAGDGFNEFYKLYINMIEQIDSKIDENYKRMIIEMSLQDYYGEIGNYFRIFHRIIKLIDENISDLDSKANYIGFLRAMINEKEMIVIFYNAFYSQRGQGLGDYLRFTNFFGDIDDLPIEEGKQPQHFSKNILLWRNDDIEKMREFKLEKSLKRGRDKS